MEIQHQQEKNISERKRKLTSSTTSDLSDNEIESDGNDKISAKRRKMYIRKGIEWKMFKPTKIDSLYYKIINNFENVYEEVEDWINTYQTNYPKAVYELLQFTIDICGYQEFDITTKFSLENENFSDITVALQENLTKEHKVGKYLFKGTSKWAAQAQTAILNFYIKLMEGLYQENLLFTDYDTLMKYFLFIFVTFILTNLRAARYTGSIIVSRLCSVCLNIEEELENLDLETLSELPNNQICIKQYVNFFLRIIKKNWINDNCLIGMKLAILKEMSKWFKRNSFVIKDYMGKLFNILLDSLVSRCPEIRLRALIAFEQLIKSKDFKHCVGPLMPNIIDGIAARINDIDYDIAISAVKLITEILKRDEQIPSGIGCKINSLVYHEFYPLARSSGYFFSVALHSVSNISSPQIVKYFINFHQTLQNTDRLTALLVESMLPWIDEFRDVELMIWMLLNDNTMTQEDEIVLIEILNNSLQQILTKKCKFVRIQSAIPMDNIDDGEVQTALNCLISYFIPLYDKFKTHKYCETQLIEILLFIDYKNLDINKFKDNVIEITEQLLLNFDGNNNNEETLHHISKFLALVKHFDSNDAIIPNKVLAVKQTTTRIFTQILQRAEQNLIQNEDNFAIECNLLHFFVLIEYHDLSHFFDSSSIFFTNIFELEKRLVSKAKIYVVKICSYYLIWKIKSAVTNYAILHNFPEQELRSISNNFISHCFTLLMDDANTIIYREIFESLTEFVVKFQNIILNSENIPKDKNISTVQFNKRQNALFTEIAIKILFENQFCTTLIARKQIFHNILTLVNFKVVAVVEVAKLFQYYHKCYKFYGEIFDSYLKVLRNVETTAVSGMIVNTLIHFYFGNICEGVLKNTDHVQFKNLLVQFRKFVGRKKKEAIEILRLTIMYISRSENRYPFLFYIKEFTLGLSHMDKRRIVSFLFDKIPKENKKNVHALDFMKFCKIK